MNLGSVQNRKLMLEGPLFILHQKGIKAAATKRLGR